MGYDAVGPGVELHNLTADERPFVEQTEQLWRRAEAIVENNPTLDLRWRSNLDNTYRLSQEWPL